MDLQLKRMLDSHMRFFGMIKALDGIGLPFCKSSRAVSQRVNII